MIIRDEIKCFAFLLKSQGGLDHAEIISDVQNAARLNAGDDAHGQF
jgi:hypothetical protein